MHNYFLSPDRRNFLTAALVLPFMLSGCGGDTLATKAEKHANTTCSCKIFKCTLKQTKWFNKTYIMDEKDIKAMSEKGQARYEIARKKNVACQDKLRK